MRTCRPFVSATASRVAMLAAVSLIAVGCSSDVTRFDDPFANPFSSKSASRDTGRSYASAAPTTRVEAAPLGDGDIVTNSAGRSKSVVAQSNPFKGRDDSAIVTNSIPSSSLTRASAPATPSVNRMAQASVTPSAPLSSGKGGWSPVGGTTIQVGASDTVETLSKRFGVPGSAIAQANGLAPGQKLTSGQSVVIPTYSMALGTSGAANVQPAATVPATAAPKIASAEPPPPVSNSAAGRGWSSGAQAAAASKPAVVTNTGRHVVNSGESLGGIAARYKVSRSDLAKANKLKVDEGVRIGQSLVIPGQAQVAEKPSAQKLVKTETVVPVKKDTVKTEVAKAEAAKVTPVKAVPVKTVAAKPVVDPDVTGSLPPQKMASPVEEAKAKAEEPAKEAAGPRDPQFRWPVRGHVISRFGQSAGGQASEGIKLAVPEGTAVRAAEDGKVAYAGSDLKHLGNLVLVRHANGYVSVYAHNSEINVRPGDEVRRGQTIAKAGQTGNATSPQLYFELRKGKSPVDPMGYLGKE